MNPPFSEYRDVTHIPMAFNLVKSGDTIVSIISENILYYHQPEYVAFQKFLKDNDAYIEDVVPQGFVESGTTVETKIIKLIKK